MEGYRHLSDQDLADGKLIHDLFSSLDNESKKMVMVYTSGVRDRQMMQEKKLA